MANLLAHIGITVGVCVFYILLGAVMLLGARLFMKPRMNIWRNAKPTRLISYGPPNGPRRHDG